MSWSSRPHKSAMRSLATRNNSNTPAKVYLTLPSDELLDVYQALEAGTINRKTYVVAVEKDTGKIPAIKKALKTQFNKFHVWNAPLSKHPLKDILQGKIVDRAFFDLCGQFTADLGLWILSWTGEEFVPGTQVSWTFNINHRYNLLMSKLDNCHFGLSNWLNTNGRWQYKQLKILGSNLTIVPTWEDDQPIKRQILQVLYCLHGGLRRRWKYNLKRVHEYHDTKSSMVYIETELISRQNTKNSIAQHLAQLVGFNFNEIPIVRHPANQRPEGISPQKWAWHPDNPTGIRRHA